MVKFDQGSVAHGDRDRPDLGGACCQDTPTLTNTISRQKITVGCSSEDGENEPLLHDICKAVNGKGPHSKNDAPINGEVTIPILVSSTDALQVKNPAATASLHSSPSHSGLVETSPSQQLSSALPLAASVALSSNPGPQRRSLQVPHHDEVVSIQMTSGCESREPRVLSGREVFECSWQGLCGPNPKKISMMVIVTLSVWASFIFVLNNHKQVSGLKSDLSFMTDKVQHLQKSYVEMQDKAEADINQLKSIVENIKNNHHRVYDRHSSPERHGESSMSKQRLPKSIKPVDTPVVVHAEEEKKVMEVKKEDCKTSDGTLCIIPFKFDGESKSGCIKRWFDPKPWCPTKLNEAGETIRFDNSAWGYCNQACPMA